MEDVELHDELRILKKQSVSQTNRRIVEYVASVRRRYTGTRGS